MVTPSVKYYQVMSDLRWMIDDYQTVQHSRSHDTKDNTYTIQIYTLKHKLINKNVASPYTIDVTFIKACKDSSFHVIIANSLHFNMNYS